MTDARDDVAEEIRFDADAGHYRATYSDPNEVSTTVILSVAQALDAEVLSLPPLNDVVDPDALNALFGPRGDGVPRTGGQVNFVVADCEVTVRSEGIVVVVPPARD